MKKIVRLTENELTKLVNKVVKEQRSGIPPRPRIKQERNPIDLGLFEKFFMGTRNANDPKFVADYITALNRELQSARVLENKLKSGESNITGVPPPRPRIKQEENPNMVYNDYGVDEVFDPSLESPLDEATIEVDPDDTKSLDMVKNKLSPEDTLRVRDLNEEDGIEVDENNPFADVPMWGGK